MGCIIVSWVVTTAVSLINRHLRYTVRHLSNSILHLPSVTDLRSVLALPLLHIYHRPHAPHTDFLCPRGSTIGSVEDSLIGGVWRLYWPSTTPDPWHLLPVCLAQLRQLAQLLALFCGRDIIMCLHLKQRYPKVI